MGYSRMSYLSFFRIIKVFLVITSMSCTSSVTDPQISSGLLGDDYFGETLLPDEVDQAPPGLSLLNFKGGEFVRSGSEQEIRWVLKPESDKDYGLFSSRIEYSEDLGNTWKQIPGAIRIPAMSGFPVSYNWKIPELSGGAQFLLRISIQNTSGEEKRTQSDKPFTLDNDTPIIVENSLVINNSQIIEKSYFKYDVDFVDSTSPVVQICAKNLNKNSQESIIPNQSDACWIKISELGMEEGLKVRLKNIFYVVGFLPGEYVFRLWAMDKAGNISVLRSGLGENGIDKKEYIYNPAKSIKFKKFVFANTNSPSNPPTIDQQDFSLIGSTVFIQYTTDDVPVSKEVTISTDGGLTYSTPKTTTPCSPVGYNECLQFSYQYNLDFQIKLKVTSSLGMVSTVVSPPLNMRKFRMIAGNLDNGLGGSANSAGFKPFSENSLVIDKKSRIYVNDVNKGVLLINPDDGSQVLYLKKDNQKDSSGDGGSVSLATTNGIFVLSIDYQNRLLIVEKDRIRRVENDGVINTIVGGASGANSMNFFPIQGCLNSTNTDLTSIKAYGSSPDFASNPGFYTENNFFTEAAFYKVNSNGNLLLNNIDRQNYNNLNNQNYEIKKENIFYENEFSNIKFDFSAAANCGFAKKPTITPLPNGDFYFEGFHSREIAIGRGSYMKQSNRGAGPSWYAYYTAPRDSKKASIKIIPFNGLGSLNYPITTGSPKAILNLDQSFSDAFMLSNPQISFNYQTNKLLNIHSRGCIYYNSACRDFYLSLNFSPKSGSSVRDGIQFIPEIWGAGGRLITSRKGQLYNVNRSNMGLHKYNASSNKFERILGTGANGQCEDGTLVLECPVDIQDAFIDDSDNIYFFDRDRVRVIVRRSSNFRDSIVVTLFGFSKSDGDINPSDPLLGTTLAARFNVIQSLSLHSDNKKLIVHDSGESLVREFSIDPADVDSFKMNRIAGNVYKTNYPTYNGSLISNEFSTESVLNFNGGVYSDLNGVVYSRAGRNVFSKLNRLGVNKNRWEVILGNPFSVPSKKLYELGTNSCDNSVLSPTACDVSDRGYYIHGILPVEGSSVPFIMVASWIRDVTDRQGNLKLIRTSANGITNLVRNLTATDWTTNLKYNYPIDAQVVGGSSNFGRYASKSQYVDVNGTGYIYTMASEVSLNETRIRYISLVRNGSLEVTSAGKIGTLLKADSAIRSFYVLNKGVNPQSSLPQFDVFLCLMNGQLRKYSFENPMNSHIEGKYQILNSVITQLQLPIGYTCNGQSIEYSTSENKIFFPVSYDGLMGVAEWTL